MQSELLQLDLNGNFKLLSPQNDTVDVERPRCRALFAILALSDGQTRSRDWLKTVIWPRSGEPQASYSLRNTLSALRRSLGNFEQALVADRTHVALVGVHVVPARPLRNTTFFEDAPNKLGQQFDDWYAIERAAWGNQEICSPMAPDSSTQRPHVVVCIPTTFGENTEDAAVADYFCDTLVGIFRQQGFIQPFDIRDTSSNLISNVSMSPDQSAECYLHVSLLRVGSQASISIQVRAADDRLVLWSSTLSADQVSSFRFTTDQLNGFATQSVEAITQAVFKGVKQQQKRAPMFAASHQILGMSIEGQKSARQILADSELLDTSGIACAWYALSLVNSFGERSSSEHDEMVAMAQFHCQRAMELDATNPIVLIIAAHVYGFLLNQLEASAEFAAQARSLGPHHPIVWDLSAMNAIYCDRPQDAIKFSSRATLLGAYSPHRHFYDSSRAIALSVAGEHVAAIAASRRILTARPGFLGVMRHLAGSLAAVGEIKEARSCIRQIQDRDPSFRRTEIRAPKSALLADQSKELLTSAFRLTGLA